MVFILKVRICTKSASISQRNLSFTIRHYFVICYRNYRNSVNVYTNRIFQNKNENGSKTQRNDQARAVNAPEMALNNAKIRIFLDKTSTWQK